jgi:hypothetical protein
MAKGNQGQGRQGEGRERHNGGTARRSQPEREQPFPTEEGSALCEPENRLTEIYESAREGMSRQAENLEDAIVRNPFPSVAIGFGIGFGLGIALTALLPRDEDSWAEWAGRSIRDPGHELSRSFQRMRSRGADWDQHHGVSELLQRSFQSLSASIRDLPSELAKLLPGR